jgi:hypothetical protein
MTPQQALDLIRSNLNTKPLTYQLGFLQGFLVKQMMEKPETIGEFKRQIKAAQNK